MIVKTSEFLISAVKEAQWPKDGLPEVLLLGRSNVGKSSFINTMVNRKNLAYTSSTPGMTRMLNFYDVNHEIRFVDAPGYGFQKKARSGYEEFERLMQEYFAKRENLKVAVLLLDVRREPNEDDALMLEFIQHYHIPCLIILTKCDKLSNNQIAKQKKVIAEALSFSKDSFCLFSSLNKTGREEAWKAIEQYL
ncbi:MAG: YihA family ribosome biogenesis GTP-binding protein [Erysipelotrichaceae bacterium]|nr:YihA family ribosome biogenesis GTP-binding protein [Erysipelotrichaceae bacterium]